MATYRYQATNASGKTVKGIIEGDSSRHARQLLREQRLSPFDIKETDGKQSQQADSSGQSFAWFSFSSRVRLSAGDLALFTRQLATLIQANLPVADALNAVAKQTEKSAIKTMILDINAKVVEGHTLAFALGEYPKVFGTMYCSMVQAGEKTGFLGQVLERLADYTESSQYTQQKVKTAMIYPIVLLVVALSVITALMILVVPKLIKSFSIQGIELPALTQLVIAMSDFIINYGLMSVLTLLVVIIIVTRWFKPPERLIRWHRVLLRLPVFGSLIRISDTARFASTLSILVSSGVPLVESLRIAGAVLSNLVLKTVCEDVVQTVQEGGSFSKALHNTGQFSPMLVHMVASGESAGELDAMLDKVASNQTREVEMKIASFLGLLEPVMIVGMSGIVMFIVLAILLPIMKLSTSV